MDKAEEYESGRAREAHRWRSEGYRLRGAGCEDVGDDRLRVTVMFGQKGEPDRSMLRRTLQLEPAEIAEMLADRVVHHLTSGAILEDDLVERTPIGSGDADQ